MDNLPVFTKPLPQIWIENNQFIIESESFRYSIQTETTSKFKNKDPLTVLFKLCRRMKQDAIASTY